MNGGAFMCIGPDRVIISVVNESDAFLRATEEMMFYTGDVG